MSSDRMRRQIDRLLDEAEEAISQRDWVTVGNRAQDVLRLDPANTDAKAFLEAGKNGLTHDTKRNATSDEVKRLKLENDDLKRALAESTLDALRYKKRLGM